MYRDFYGFTGKPFQLSPDSRFYFNSKPHNRAMAYLRYGLEKREGFIVITGGIGTGKTMLVRHLLSELETSDVIAAQLVTTQVEPEDMLRIVCASFGLGQEGAPKSTLLDKLEKFFRAREAEGKRVLLVVDEAQNLPLRSIEELRMLSNFQYDGKSLLQSFLLGQIEFDRTLQSPAMEQFRQRIIAALHLKPMDSEETRRYIEYRLTKVDWTDDPQITAGAFEQIYEFCQGIPRRINTLCDRLLLFGCLEERHLLDENAVKTVVKEIEDEGLGPHTAVEPEAQLAPALPVTTGISTAAVTAPDGDQLLQRLGVLEQEMQSLKKTVQHERKLLRKAILIQMDMDIEDELD